MCEDVIGIMEFRIVDRDSEWLDKVIALGDSCRATIGFMPKQAFADYAYRKEILALIIDKALVAYVMYRYKGPSLIIVHMCVSEKYRRHGYAKKLMDALFAQEKKYVTQFELYCRRDYGLENFWHSLGFVPIAEKAGRAFKSETTLTTWIHYNPDHQNLFITLFPRNTGKAKVVLDSNIIISLYDGNGSEASALNQDFLNYYIEYFVSKDIFNEINKQENTRVRNETRDFIKNWFPVITQYDEQLYAQVKKSILELKPAKEYSNTWYDISHISYAIAFGAEAFITCDSEWLNTPISHSIFERYGLKIYTPSELIRCIDELDSPLAYAPQKLLGLSLEYSEMKSSDFEGTVNTFYQYYNPPKKSAFSSSLRGWMSAPDKYHIFLVKSGETPVCLLMHYLYNNVKTVQTILINPHALKPSLINTFIKRIAFMILEDAKNSSASSISILKNDLQPDMIEAFKECGYFENGHALERIIERKIILPVAVPNVVSVKKESPLQRIVEKYAEGAIHGVVSARATVELEKVFWPLKIDTPCVCNYIVPIQAEYAQKLFDEDLANTNMSLFHNENFESALSIENIYYKSKRKSISCFPARILWYVSRSKQYMGSGAIRACSYLDLVEIGDKSSLYKKYRRLGILTWQEIKNIQREDNCIAAYKFSYTEQLSHPVFLDDIRKIIENPSVTFQSFLRIDNQIFFKLYKSGTQGLNNA